MPQKAIQIVRRFQRDHNWKDDLVIVLLSKWFDDAGLELALGEHLIEAARKQDEAFASKS